MNGCDDVFDDWIWTSWFIGRSRFNLPEPSPLTQIHEPTRFMLKPSLFFTVFANYTSVSIYYTIFIKKIISSLFLFP